MEPWSQLKGKVVFVTGASSGLGLEFCLDLAKAGCKIVAAARRIDKLQSLCDHINKLYHVPVGVNGSLCRATAVALDITANGTRIEASVGEAWNAFGHIDLLINNAGVRGQVKLSVDMSEEEWDHLVKTNLTGAWLVSKYIGARMIAAGRGGSIINISSVSALPRGLRTAASAYSSSKAGLDAMTKVLALEFGRFNIRVNSIAPGIFKSDITKDLMEKKWLKNVEKKSVPLGTLGTTDPGLTSLIRYLLHESSSFVTGNVFIVDSGYTLLGIPILSSL